MKGARDATGLQALVFEEVATMDFPFEGIPTVPPRKDMAHFAFFCDGCRYRSATHNGRASLPSLTLLQRRG